MSTKNSKKIIKKVVEESDEEEIVEKKDDKKQLSDEEEQKENDTESSGEEEKKDTKKEEVKTEKKSIIEFDHNEVRKMDVGAVKQISDIDMLKILLVRGEDSHNPALWGGSQRLLRQLNMEFRDKPFNPAFNKGRGQYVRRYPETNTRDEQQYNQAPQIQQRPNRQIGNQQQYNPNMYRGARPQYQPRQYQKNVYDRPEDD